jgi:hypothetical protein
MAQLTQQGFTVRTLQQIIDEISGNLKATFGTEFNTDPSSPNGQLIGIFAEQLWTQEQAAQAVYLSNDPDSTTGVALEYTCDYNGVYRLEGESDAQLRNRRQFSVINQGTNTIESIYSALQKLGAEFTSIRQNVTNTTDANGLPAKSFQVVVKGAEDDAIAQAIFDNKPAGIQAYGDVTKSINDSKGYPHPVAFTRPSEVKIDVDVSIKPISGAFEDLKDYIEEAVQFQLNEYQEIGMEVLWSDVFAAAVFASNGGPSVSTPLPDSIAASVRSVKIARQGETTATNDISMLFHEKAVAGTITVTEVS